jgi:hypothetical protein
MRPYFARGPRWFTAVDLPKCFPPLLAPLRSRTEAAVQIDGIQFRLIPKIFGTHRAHKVPQPIAAMSPKCLTEMDDLPPRHAQSYALAERLTGRAATALEQIPDLA